MFLPIYTYAKQKGIKKQNIYRLIREKRLIEGKEYKTIEKVVQRLVISDDFDYEKAKQR